VEWAGAPVARSMVSGEESAADDGRSDAYHTPRWGKIGRENPTAEGYGLEEGDGDVGVV
jgi:hypothetical protein